MSLDNENKYARIIERIIKIIKIRDNRTYS